MIARRKIGLLLAFCTSVGVHGVAYASLSAEHREPQASEISELNFELSPLPLPVAAPKPEPPNEVPEPQATPPALAVVRAPPVHRPADAAVAPTLTPAAPALDLSGVTLTNETGVGFAMPVGDGSGRHGPIGLGTDRAPAVLAPSAAPSSPKPPPLVDASDLSERPRPPSLTGLLRENYPDEARQRGLRGSASLRARIDADGVIRSARVRSESSAGFGSACRRTLLGSRWSAPRDKNGSAVATEIVYTCHFEIDQ